MAAGVFVCSQFYLLLTMAHGVPPWRGGKIGGKKKIGDLPFGKPPADLLLIFYLAHYCRHIFVPDIDRDWRQPPQN